MVRELAEVGIECEPVRVDDYTGKKMTFFHDPDGLPLGDGLALFWCAL